MALPSSGAITLSDVNTNIGASSTANITMNDLPVRLLSTGSPTTNPVTMNGLYGKSWIWTTNLSQSGFSGFNPQSIAVDSSGNIYLVTNSTSPKVSVAKINAAGVTEWIVQLGASSYVIESSGEYGSVAVDSSGNVYVSVGSYSTSGPVTNQRGVVKLNSSGAIQWSSLTSIPTGPGGIFVSGTFGFDSSGNVYHCAFSEATFGSYGTTIFKYSSSGTLLWQKKINNVQNATNMVVDTTNSYLYLGGAIVSGGYGGGYIGKFDLSLSPSWERYFNFSTTTSSGGMQNIAVSASQNVYAVFPGISGYLLLVAYNSSGTVSWKTIASSTTYQDFLVATDSSDNVYAFCRGPAPYVYRIYFKFNSSGSLIAQMQGTPTGGVSFGYSNILTQGSYFYAAMDTNTGGASDPNGGTLFKVPNTLTTSGTYGLVTFSTPSYSFSTTSSYISNSISTTVSTTSFTEVTGAVTATNVTSSYTRTVYPI
jgi:hypothetical protein